MLTNRREVTMSLTDHLIEKLLAWRNLKWGDHVSLTVDELHGLCQAAMQVFDQEESLLVLPEHLAVCGGIHGHYNDLLKVFDVSGSPRDTQYLFLGSYLGDGGNSLETICLLLCYKVKYPKTFFMLRGNHEEPAKIAQYLASELIECDLTAALQDFVDVCAMLPLGAVIRERIFCVHGGMAHGLKSPDDIRKIKRPVKHPDPFVRELLESRPDPDVEAWGEDPDDKVSLFGESVLREFLDANEFDLMCRSGKIVNGFDFEPFEDHIILTISCVTDITRGSVLRVKDDLMCAFDMIEPE